MNIDEARMAYCERALLLLDADRDRFAGERVVRIRTLSADGELATVTHSNGAVGLANVGRLTWPRKARIPSDSPIAA